MRTSRRRIRKSTFPISSRPSFPDRGGAPPTDWLGPPSIPSNGQFAGRALEWSDGCGGRDARGNTIQAVESQRAARTGCFAWRMAMTDIGTGTYPILTQIAG